MVMRSVNEYLETLSAEERAAFEARVRHLCRFIAADTARVVHERWTAAQAEHDDP